MQKKVKYSHEEFLAGIDHLEREIRSSGRNYSYVLGVVRGGAIPAVYLSHRLQLPVQLIHWSTRDSGILGNESDCCVAEDLVAGQKILLVEDIIDSGLSVVSLKADFQKSVLDLIPEDAIDNVALWYNMNNENHVPCKYFHKEHREEWVIFPWEINDKDLRID